MRLSSHHLPSCSYSNLWLNFLHWKNSSLTRELTSLNNMQEKPENNRRIRNNGTSRAGIMQAVDGKQKYYLEWSTCNRQSVWNIQTAWITKTENKFRGSYPILVLSLQTQLSQVTTELNNKNVAFELWPLTWLYMYLYNYAWFVGGSTIRLMQLETLDYTPLAPS